MKKCIAFALVLLLVLAVPVSAEDYYVHDDEGLLESHDVVKLEEVYSDFSAQNGFDVALATVDGFGGLSAESFAKELYEVYGYSQDTMLYLVSLTEGEWYILLKGECASRLSDAEASQIGEELVELLRSGQYYAAFLAFPDAALELYLVNAPVETEYAEGSYEEEELTFIDCYITFGGVGFLVALIVVVVMLVQMRSVRSAGGAQDYICAGSIKLTSSRDIFLYAHTSRRPKPKPSSSSGGSSGRSTGGAGGRI